MNVNYSPISMGMLKSEVSKRDDCDMIVKSINSSHTEPKKKKKKKRE